MLQSDHSVARILEQRSHHRPEARDQYRRRGRYGDGGTGACQHDGRSTVQNAECNARPIRFLTNPAQPGEHCLLSRRTDQSESFASKVSRDNRILMAEWVVRGKYNAPALPPQLFNDESICVPRLRRKYEIDCVCFKRRKHLRLR